MVVAVGVVAAAFAGPAGVAAAAEMAAVVSGSTSISATGVAAATGATAAAAAETAAVVGASAGAIATGAATAGAGAAATGACVVTAATSGAASAATGAVIAEAAVIGGAAEAGAIAGAAAFATNPVGWAILGAGYSKQEYTWDCWKAVVHDESITKSQGRYLKDIFADERVVSVKIIGTKLEKPIDYRFEVKNMWNETFQILPVELKEGVIAFHADKL